MPQYTPPVRDTRFVLEHVVGLGNYANYPGFETATPDVVEAVLEEGGRFVAEVLFPLNQSGDQEGCTRHPDGTGRGGGAGPGRSGGGRSPPKIRSISL